MSAIAEPYQVHDGFVSTCAICFPDRALYDLFPDLRGTPISHGLCQRHFAQLMDDLRESEVEADGNVFSREGTKGTERRAA